MAKSKKYVYFFGGGKAEGKAEMKALLGGKGANLAEMVNLGLPRSSLDLQFRQRSAHLTIRIIKNILKSLISK
ncbi:MAG: hypothetical protein MZV64_62195 [Ignavibacteriales bacterium]|nr:hypothetical protein [Ignavibacteriales bacterium]